MTTSARHYDPRQLFPLPEGDLVRRLGRVIALSGTVIRACVPDVGVGQRCRIRSTTEHVVEAEVIGFDESGVLLMPLSPVAVLVPGAIVEPCGRVPEIPSGSGVRGRVLNALGRPLDDQETCDDLPTVPLMASSPNPMRRRRVNEVIPTGVRCIDSLLTVGRGQRMGIFALAGGGKSTLLGMIARSIQADAVVVGLIGERGREVVPFIEDNLGAAGLAKSTVFVSCSDEPALLRLRAAHAATAVAEALRSQGAHVVLLMDSVTRFARALREVALAAGELPARRGFPPSVFAELPRLFERAGNDGAGSITAFYTILVEGNVEDDPIAEETKSLLDGHIVLSPALGQRGQWPAIDVLRSTSRIMSELIDPPHASSAQRARALMALYDEHRDQIEMGIYESGALPALDEAIAYHEPLRTFLRQDEHAAAPFADSLTCLNHLLGQSAA